MDLFFLSYDSAFYWDRAGSLESTRAKEAGIRACAIFRERRFNPASILVFNRFADTRFYRLFYHLCRLLHIPYIVDVDDLFWELPSFSSDRAARDSHYVAYLDRLITHARVVTTTNEELRAHLSRRYPAADIRVIENCPPAWFAPKCAALIANTDSFKLGGSDLGWFAELLSFLHDSGLGLQFIGENGNMLAAAREFECHTLPSVPLKEYLALLNSRNFRIGLIPVAQSAYADCKSAIKMLEFVSQGMEVIASDILPYRTFKSEFPSARVTLVDNTRGSWLSALKCAIARIPAAELAEGRAINSMLAAKREVQFQQWLEVVKVFQALPVHAGKLRVADAVVRWYEALRACGRLLLLPIVKMQRLLQA